MAFCRREGFFGGERIGWAGVFSRALSRALWTEGIAEKSGRWSFVLLGVEAGEAFGVAVWLVGGEMMGRWRLVRDVSVWSDWLGWLVTKGDA